MKLRISNRCARRLLVFAHGLAAAPTGPLNLTSLIDSLGYVQLDTIRNVTRAHHHILWSRNQSYREPMLWTALKQRSVFEHFTHDASILPIRFYPLWEHQFRRMRKRLASSESWRKGADLRASVLTRIDRDGPLSTHDFESKVTGKKEMWTRPPHKRALDQLWYTGELTTSHRENFTKFYDLADRTIPTAHRTDTYDADSAHDRLCREALTRLSIATRGQLQDFWGAASSAETQHWLNESPDAYVPVQIESCTGDWINAYAAPDIEARIQTCPAPTTRLRILSPFDPLIRDRTRLLRIFGFDYRIEIFVPQAKRRWGYYVYPLLEADRLVGRIELKADRKSETLSVLNFWSEAGTTWTQARESKLQAEIQRLARLIGCASSATI